MANFYYELHDGAIYKWDNKYNVVYSEFDHTAEAAGWDMTQHSNRIWKEDSNGVRFVKNRFHALSDPVDLKEFMWIKLKAQSYIKGA